MVYLIYKLKKCSIEDNSKERGRRGNSCAGHKGDGDTRNSTVSLSFFEKRALRSLWKPRPRLYYKYRFSLNCTSHTFGFLSFSSSFLIWFLNSSSFSAVRCFDFCVRSLFVAVFGIRVRICKLVCSPTERSSLFYLDNFLWFFCSL